MAVIYRSGVLLRPDDGEGDQAEEEGAKGGQDPQKGSVAGLFQCQASDVPVAYEVWSFVDITGGKVSESEAGLMFISR